MVHAAATSIQNGASFHKPPQPLSSILIWVGFTLELVQNGTTLRHQYPASRIPKPKKAGFTQLAKLVGRILGSKFSVNYNFL